jgi:hypothetical protein
MWWLVATIYGSERRARRRLARSGGRVVRAAERDAKSGGMASGGGWMGRRIEGVMWGLGCEEYRVSRDSGRSLW